MMNLLIRLEVHFGLEKKGSFPGSHFTRVI